MSTASATSTSTAMAPGLASPERGSGAATALIEPAQMSAAAAPLASAEPNPRTVMVPPSNINPAPCRPIEHGFTLLSSSILHQLSRRDFNPKAGKSHIGHLG